MAFKRIQIFPTQIVQYRSLDSILKRPKTSWQVIKIIWTWCGLQWHDYHCKL